MSDAYLDLVMGAQALRREVEREAVDLFGALGIAAWRLPHQIANVTRVLTAPRVRHLLADEVGLGKTVQALMILNALRLQSRGALRALVVVPDALVAQWRDELLSRGHEAPARDGEEPADEEDQRAARLAWPGRMVASEIDPSRYDLLIVDELHALRVDIQARIVRQAPLFSHVLILTATPPFHEPARLVDLLRVLEPARVAAAEALDPDPERMIERLRRQEREVARLVLAGGGDREAWAEHGGQPPPETMASSAAIACCVLRGVVRARRADWPELLPTRALRVVEVEPTEAEVERLALLWRYFTYLPEMTREFDLDLLAQRALRGVASLAQRVTYLRGHGHEREGLLAQVAPLLDRRLGDSRLDGLCDLLAEIWEAEPDARILVVAGDNLTADDLAERLPELLGRVGPAEARVEVKPVKVRNQAKALDSDSDPEHEIESAVTRFRDGQANLLLAAEVGKVGLNLQWTRHLILYSVPWDPQDVEQWLGRVDRIGNPALGLADGELAPIQIYAIAWRGLVDHQILEVIRAAGVLERSVSLDGEAVSRIREAIRVAALSDAPDGWPRLLGQARALARGSELDDEAAPLARWLPWTAEVGMEAYRRLAERRAIEPALGDRRKKDGFEDRERALMGWLYAAEKARVYRLGGLPAPRGARTLGYPEIAAGVGGARVSVSDLPHPQGALKDHLPRLSARASFLARRRDLTSPPVREVVDGGEKRHYLHFLDHGSHLHDELVQTWLHVAAQGEEIFKLQLLSRHPAGPLRNRWVRLRIARWSPSALLPGSSADDDPLVAAARMADERFLAQHAPARLLVHGATVSEAGAEPISTELALALLRPQVDERGQWPWCEPAARPSWASRGLIEQADAALDRQARALVEAELAAAWPALSQAIEERQHLLAVEGHALLVAPARPPTGELRAALARETDVNRLRRAWLRGVTLEAEGARAVHVARSALIRLS